MAAAPAAEAVEEAASLAAEPQAEAAESETPPPSPPKTPPSWRPWPATEDQPVNNGIELGFFASDVRTVLDAGSFMDAVAKVVDGASQLHTQLIQTTSVKDLFLLKQEILNQQEILRKVFFRVVRFCDKEGGRLPELLQEIISSRGMKDVIERLTMANWSDPSDFKPFLNELKAMKRAYEVRTASAAGYLKSILDEIEGREN